MDRQKNKLGCTEFPVCPLKISCRIWQRHKQEKKDFLHFVIHSMIQETLGSFHKNKRRNEPEGDLLKSLRWNIIHRKRSLMAPFIFFPHHIGCLWFSQWCHAPFIFHCQDRQKNHRLLTCAPSSLLQALYHSVLQLALCSIKPGSRSMRSHDTVACVPAGGQSYLAWCAAA